MKSWSDWIDRTVSQIRGVNPFDGDCLPARVPLLQRGRPTLPFPHLWNYKCPIQILDTYFFDADSETGSARHNRYLDVPGFPAVLVSRDTGIIKAILAATSDKPGHFDRDTLPTDGIARATGTDSLLYSNGPDWRKQRKLAAPAFGQSSLFQPEKFHEFEQTFRKTAGERIELLRQRQTTTELDVTRVELESEISVVMLEMLVNNFFGGKVSYEQLRDRFVPSLTFLIDHMVTDTIVRKIPTPFRKLLLEDEKLKQAQRDFEALTDIALDGRSRNLGLWKQFKSDAPDQALRSNIRVFLAGALEATTSLAGWTLSHLSRAPDVQQQIYAEVREMNAYEPENLAQAATLKRVLEETLRLTPSLYFLPRMATVDTWVETEDRRKLFIPEGTHVLLDVWHANRCEDFWGVEVSGYPADVFAPQRWDILADKGFRRKDILHFGFGFGPRTCPGISLGLLEVGLVVGAFIKLFKFSAANDTVQPSAGVSTKPADKVLVDLKIRAM